MDPFTTLRTEIILQVLSHATDFVGFESLISTSSWVNTVFRSQPCKVTLGLIRSNPITTMPGIQQLLRNIAIINSPLTHCNNLENYRQLCANGQTNGILADLELRPLYLRTRKKATKKSPQVQPGISQLKRQCQSHFSFRWRFLCAIMVTTTTTQSGALPQSQTTTPKWTQAGLEPRAFAFRCLLPREWSALTPWWSIIVQVSNKLVKTLDKSDPFGVLEWYCGIHGVCTLSGFFHLLSGVESAHRTVGSLMEMTFD